MTRAVLAPLVVTLNDHGGHLEGDLTCRRDVGMDLGRGPWRASELDVPSPVEFFSVRG